MEVSIKTWIENFDKGEYNSPARHIQCLAGWYDWFCRDSSLAGKTQEARYQTQADSKEQEDRHRETVCLVQE